MNSDKGKEWGFDIVPVEARLPWFRIAAIWAGALICVPAFLMGGMVVQGLSFWPSLAIIVAGYFIVALLISLMGLVGSKYGTPSSIVASNSFGVYGSRFLISLIMGISLGGWFGVQTVVMASSFNTLINSLAGFSVPLPLSIIFWGVVVAITAFVGYSALAKLSWVTVPLLLILAVWGLIAGLTSYGGWSAVLNYVPQQPFPWVIGFTAMVGWFASGICVAPDIQRYGQPTFLNSFKASFLGIFPAGILLSGSGAIMAIAANNPDLTVSMSKLGLGIPSLILLILATWTTNVLNIYSGGLALTNVFGLGSKSRTLVTTCLATLGIILALAGIMESLQPFLLALTVLLPPYMGVVLGDYFVLRNHEPKTIAVSWPALAAWAAGALTASLVHLGVPFINGLVVAFVLYTFVFKALMKNTGASA